MEKSKFLLAILSFSCFDVFSMEVDRSTVLPQGYCMIFNDKGEGNTFRKIEINIPAKKRQKSSQKTVAEIQLANNTADAIHALNMDLAPDMKKIMKDVIVQERKNTIAILLQKFPEYDFSLILSKLYGLPPEQIKSLVVE